MTTSIPHIRRGLLWVVFVLFSLEITAQIQINMDLQKPKCHGYTDGSATAYVSGGQEPYSYQWSVATASGNQAWGLSGGSYSLTVTDANGATAVEYFTLAEPPQLEADVLKLGDECTGTTYGVNATGGTPAYSYAWNTGETGQVVTDPNTSFLMVTVTDAFGCQAVGTSPVTDPLHADLQMSDITCNNYNDGVGVVTGTGGQPPYQYLWSTGSTDVYVSGLQEGTYSVTVIDANGCTATASGTVSNPPATEVTIIKDPECGVPTTITVIPTAGVGPFMFMWGDGGDGVGPDSIYTDFQGGTVYLCVMNANHCPHDVWVTASPGFDLNANVTDADCNGADGSIDLMPSTVIAPVTYNWTGPNGFTAHTEDISGLAPGVYSVTATDLGGCSATYTATVGQQQAVAADFDYMLLNCDNNELAVQFSAYPNDPNATYSWSFSGDQQQQVGHFTSNPGDVTLTIDYGNGCTASVTKPVNLDVVDVTVPSSLQACAGDDLQISVQNNNSTPIDYLWTPADLILSGANTPNPVINTSVAGDHSLEVQMTNANGCSVTQTIPVQVQDPSAFNVDPNQISYKQCEGQKVDFSDNNANAGNYHWLFPDGTTSNEVNPSFDFSALGSGTYQVMLVPENQTCANPVPYEVTVGDPAEAKFAVEYIGCVDSIAFIDQSTAPAPITGWTWNFPDEYKEQNPTIPVDVVNGQDFEAKLTIEFGDGCVLSVDKQIPLNVINDDIPAQQAICTTGGSVNLNPDGGNSNLLYNWTPADDLDDPHSPNPKASPDQDQVYTVAITAINGTDTCTVIKQETVLVAPVSIHATGDTVVCDGSALVPVSASYMGDTFGWYDDDPGVTMPFTTNPDTMLPPGTYYAVVENTAGCSQVDTVSIELSLVSVTVTQDSFKLCNGETASLEVQDPNANPSWYLNGELVGTGSPLDVNPTVSGTYVAQVTNADGCETYDTVQVDVIQVDVSVSATDTLIYKGQTTELSAGDGFVSYEWTPDDGSLNDNNLANPTAMPQQTTTYTVMVTDTNGCTAEKSITIEVQNTACDEPFIYLPNAFSPNGDGKNDVLYLRGLNLTDIYLAVYNRWGQMVFETRDQDVGWDGTFNGEPVVPDVYGYYLRVRCDNGQEFFKKGNITVLK